MNNLPIEFCTYISAISNLFEKCNTEFIGSCAQSNNSYIYGVYEKACIFVCRAADALAVSVRV